MRDSSVCPLYSSNEMFGRSLEEYLAETLENHAAYRIGPVVEQKQLLMATVLKSVWLAVLDANPYKTSFVILDRRALAHGQTPDEPTLPLASKFYKVIQLFRRKKKGLTKLDIKNRVMLDGI
ncbi:hypothetical protein AVEN_174112-1 [Araneus ventricosus]|uniref:Uncharacterized protein n=1 Tax=Araneus ventricosus TaxID=182803 RepID=A0A4Y2C1X5_ARAVE|nr:hypothetical protein AVEN_174112-1 [Araneus ventricosus]